MTVQVLIGQEVIFSTSDGENALVPLDESERAKAFHALTSALAILCGVTVPEQSGPPDDDRAENQREIGSPHSTIVRFPGRP